MIYSSFRANDDLKKYPEAVRTALEYLKSKDFTKMEVGTYPIQGKDIYALVQEITTCPIGQRRAEVHKQYLDIQYLCTGEETYGVAPDVGQDTITESKEQNDIYFFDSGGNIYHAERRRLSGPVPGRYPQAWLDGGRTGKDQKSSCEG